MIGKTISHYKILEKLGKGGMGVAYKAKAILLWCRMTNKFLRRHILGVGLESKCSEVSTPSGVKCL